MLILFVSMGSFTERGTEVRAARCNTYSASCIALRTISMSVMLPLMKVILLRIFGEVIFFAGREVVQHDHAVAAADEFVHRVRADKTGAARNEVAHSGIPPRFESVIGGVPSAVNDCVRRQRRGPRVLVTSEFAGGIRRILPD